MRSGSSLTTLAYGDPWNVPPTPRTQGSDVSSSVGHAKMIIVANFLPLHAQKDLNTGTWSFSFDEDSLLLQLKDGFSSETGVVYVGSLKVDVDASEQDEVAQRLLEEFNCVPTFLSPDLHKKFYLRFCKQHLWPLFHYLLPLLPDYGNLFDRLLWQAYVSANNVFAEKVMEVTNPDEDFIWIHDYHLMVLPIFLRRHFNKVKIGFFLHSPFPSSEIFRTLPVRDEILKALLNADLIGFQTYDYARHFLSCCSRLLGLHYASNRGYIGVEYFGRTVCIKILSVGVHIGQIESTLNLPSTSVKIKAIQEQMKGKKLIVSVDDMDIFKGISLKLLAMEQLLEKHPKWRAKLVLVQIVNPPRSTGKDTEKEKWETFTNVTRINDTYGSPGYEPVILIDSAMPLNEKAAYYTLADCCIVNALRDGMNLIPYKYIVCRQGTPTLDEAMGIAVGSLRTSTLVVSEFIGCSPSLSGAFKVNPWDIEAVAESLNEAITIRDLDKQLQHEKHYRYVSSHDVVYWARTFVKDLEQACKDHKSKRCWGIGFGLNYRVLSLSPSFRKLYINDIVSVYNRTNRRAIFLDYDGTLVPQASIANSPSPEVISVLNNLCSDPKNTVFIVSGRGKDSLNEWFAECENLGIAAEHGYFIRWNRTSNWKFGPEPANFDWKRIAQPVMQLYTETTDGSYIEFKESALVWHHRDADPTFGSCQAKELLDHLENVLANEPVVVKRGQHIVEVKLQGITKGLVTRKVLLTLTSNKQPQEPPDFVLCIGDDRSDEDMFESISSAGCSSSHSAEIFACTVGQKPSKAQYYLNDIDDVLRLLQGLAAAQVSSTDVA